MTSRRTASLNGRVGGSGTRVAREQQSSLVWAHGCQGDTVIAARWMRMPGLRARIRADAALALILLAALAASSAVWHLPARLSGPLAARLAARFEEAFHVDGGTLRVTARVGLAVPDGDSVSAEELFHRADMAMYEAERSSRGTDDPRRPRLLTQSRTPRRNRRRVQR